jgi:hypothetical protein
MRRAASEAESNARQRFVPRGAESLLVDLAVESKPLELTVLFIPFEGNMSSRMMSGLCTSGPMQVATRERVPSLLNVDFKKFGAQEPAYTSSNAEVSGSNKNAFRQLWKNQFGEDYAKGFYQLVVEDRLSYIFNVPNFNLPMVIVLSEELFQFPNALVVFDCIYDIAALSGQSARNLQRMAVYRKRGVTVPVQIILRPVGEKHEYWAVIGKGQSEASELVVACVHLSSQFTSANEEATQLEFDNLAEFCGQQGIDAILGDLNMNSKGCYGGAFPIESVFLNNEDTAEVESAFKFITSSGSGKAVYMGGLVFSPRVWLQHDLKHDGMLEVPPTLSTHKNKPQGDIIFSDHTSLFSHYRKSIPPTFSGLRLLPQMQLVTMNELYDNQQRFRIMKMPPDGNCLIHALIKINVLPDTTITEARKTIADDLEFPENHNLRVCGISVDTQLLIPIANKYKVKIILYEAYYGANKWHIFSETDTVGPVVRLLIWSVPQKHEAHYDLVVT